MGMYFDAVALEPEKLRALLKKPKRIAAPRGAPQVSLDKLWHAVHYTLTGTAGASASPLGAAVLGGTNIGPDIGYGPARYLEPDEVASVAAALRAVPPEDFASRFDAAALVTAGVYPELLWSQRLPTAAASTTAAYVALRDFYVAAAARGDAVILRVT